MAYLKSALQQFLQHHPTQSTIWIALSGGVDSLVLLHAAQALRQTVSHLAVKAIHVNHQLSVLADQWQQQVEAICLDWQIPLYIEKVRIEVAPGQSVEDQARKARYQVFKKIIQLNDWVWTAHHQDDQAETVLLQLFRGAGVRGLSAMHEAQPLGAGFLGRPFLSISRSQIEDYAKAHDLEWVEDHSNADETYSRNFLRHQVLPLLATRWPGVKKKLAQTASHLQEAHALLEELAFADWQESQKNPPSPPFSKGGILTGANKESLSRHHHVTVYAGAGGVEEISALTYVGADCISPLCKRGAGGVLLTTLPRDRLKNFLRYWIKQEGFALPNQKKLAAIIDEVIYAKVDAKSCVQWGGVEIRRYQDRLYLLPALPPFTTGQRFSWKGDKPFVLPANLGELQLVNASSPLAAASWSSKIAISSQDKIEIRFREGGERCYLPHRQGSQALKKLFQEWGIPPWARDRIPLLYLNGELAVVVGFAVCRDFLAVDNEANLLIFKEF